VGKAKNLKNRLSSYFSGEKALKTQLLISNAVSIEYITTANEYEAFILENNLIKKHSPKYNIQLKDGKSYPVLKITNEEFPRVLKIRQVKKDGSQFFGPYPDATALESFIEAIYKIYPLRHCRTFKKKNSPCMYYHIGRCKAPCCGKIDKRTYSEFIDEIKSLLEGKGDESISKLTEMMKAAASELNFEKAARIRDGIKALTVMQNQNIVEDFNSGDDSDYIGFYREGELVSFTVLKIRDGKLLGRDNFQPISLSEDWELFEEFAVNFYTEKSQIPNKIFVLQDDIEQTGQDAESGGKFLSKFLNEKFSMNIEVLSVANENSAIEKKHKALLGMAKHNAHEDIIRRMRERGDFPAMEELKKMLGLPRLPQRIEGFDIAHIGGKFPIASLISFWNGNPDKKNYREYRLKTTDGIIDDFASMKEATARRYSRLLNDKKELPDLILIDGGIGQVNAVDDIIKSLDLDIPIAGLAKRDEEIWRPHASKPICLPKRSDALRLLQRVRDETHRFATSRNQELRTKENTESAFKELPHVGEKREKILLKTFTTLENLANAEESQIAQALHVRALEASEILFAAKTMWQKQKDSIERKKEQIDAELGTGEKAADYGAVLAEFEEENSMHVADGGAEASGHGMSN
jgi:excinuclease ABC subunit C